MFGAGAPPVPPAIPAGGETSFATWLVLGALLLVVLVSIVWAFRSSLHAGTAGIERTDVIPERAKDRAA
jgi:hypothetical protein